MSSSYRLVAGSLLACVLFCGGRATAAEEWDLEPVPPMIAFPARDPAPTERDAPGAIIRAEIGRTFASLGDVSQGRALLVYRFGVLSAIPLAERLATDSGAYAWNALLTIAALRDTYGPALELVITLKPVERLLAPAGQDFHTSAFAALAAGSFHWTQARALESYRERLGDYEAVPGPAEAAARVARSLDDLRLLLVRCVGEKQEFLQCAALLALGKMGGPEARKAVEGAAAAGPGATQPHRALLLARAFLGSDDPDPFLTVLRDPDRRLRAAAALGIAVRLLSDRAPPWARDTEHLLKELQGPQVRLHTEEGPETVFARGVCALVGGAHEEWRKLWELATQPSSEHDLAAAAAQVLLFCREPWFEQEAVQWARSPRVTLKDPVLALVLLRAGQQGTVEGIEACERWLRKKSQRPVPDDAWDPRWYAAVGLLRALQAGRIKVQERRVRVVETLRFAATRVLDRKAVPREVLEALLDQYGNRITEAEETALFRLPLPALRRAETSFRRPWALLSRDALDACTRRVNDMVESIFGLEALKEGTPDDKRIEKQPEKFLKRYVDRHPYFTRLEFFVERGRRPPRGLDVEGGKGVDR